MSGADGSAAGTRLVVRAMVEVASAAEAGMEARRISARVAPFAEVARSTVARYEKIAHFWEVTLHLHPPARSANAVFDRLRAEAAAGWTVGERGPEDVDRWAVWNAMPGLQLFSPRVQWAEIQLWREGGDTRGGAE